MAVCPYRAWIIDPVRAHFPVAGLYSSALDRPPPALVQHPPATSTSPPRSKVAVASLRAAGMLPVGAKVRVAGSYNSAEALPPPAMSTLPLVSSVAVCPVRATDIGAAVGAQVFAGPLRAGRG